MSQVPRKSTREEDGPEKGLLTSQLVTEHLHTPGPELGVQGLECQTKELRPYPESNKSHRQLVGRRMAGAASWTQRCHNPIPFPIPDGSHGQLGRVGTCKGAFALRYTRPTF